MTTKVEKSVLVDVPVSTAYNQWTQFEEFPRFMSGVERVTQLGEDRLEWVAEIAGVRRQWTARILEQVPDRKVAWAAVEGATNAGAVAFEEAGDNQTTVNLTLEYEPEGFLENVADKLQIIAKQAEEDLERFKDFIESQGVETGAWRGEVREGSSVGTPKVEDAGASRGDSGKVYDDGVDPSSLGIDSGEGLASNDGVTGTGSTVPPLTEERSRTGGGVGSGDVDDDPVSRAEAYGSETVTADDAFGRDGLDEEEPTAPGR